MKKILSVFLSVLMIASSFAFAASAEVEWLTPEESQSVVDAAYNAMFDGVAGDVNDDGAFNVADARAALLSSAGLDEGTINKTKADTDGDGVVTAIDARILLRAAANLEPTDVLYTPQMKLDLFNALVNDIKYSSEKYRKFKTDETVDITHDNQAAIDDFNKQMNNIAKVMGSDETFDFAEAISASAHTVSYTYSYANVTATKNNYPVSGQNFASILSLKDIDSITYAENQTYNFEPKRNNAQSQETPLTMTGLDAITITFKDEALTDLPDDMTTLAHGKCFDIPNKNDIMSGYDNINKELESIGFNELIDMLDNGSVFNISADFKSINYHDSSVTLYFKHDTKEVCLVSYDLYYDFTVAIFMDIFVSFTGSEFIALLNFRNKTINFTDSERQKIDYYFPVNYPYPISD